MNRIESSEFGLINGYTDSIDGHRFYLNMFGKLLQFDICNMLEFTSKRKRMSNCT